MKPNDIPPAPEGGFFVPLILVVVGCAVLLMLGGWLENIKPPPSQRIYVPYQWVCQSKYRGGTCQRTGGYDSNGQPWGTAVPRP
jgi:hypothetical protein